MDFLQSYMTSQFALLSIGYWWIFGLFVAAFIAGYVDSVAGGGGTIQVPLLLLTGIPPISVLATNKMIAIIGTISATINYSARKKVIWQALAALALPCLVASILGSALALTLPGWLLEVMILIFLLTIIVLSLLSYAMNHNKTPSQIIAKPMSMAPAKVDPSMRSVGAYGLIGFYDGISGPGTGLLLAKANKSYLSLGLLNSVATAKPLNLMTNTGALVVFFFAGKIIWIMAVPMIVGNVIGNWFGSHMAIKNGDLFVKYMMFVSLLLLVVSVAYKVSDYI